MFAKALVEQYSAASDDDLKYMILRQDLTICQLEQDVDLLVKEVLLPVLLEETDPEIVELVSSQVYPQIVLQCIEKMKAGSSVQWFDDLIVGPLLDKIETKRASFIIQTIRNVFKAVGEVVIILGSSTEKFIRLLIAHMKMLKGKSGEGNNTVLYWETLDLMISAYYDPSTRMTFEVLNGIFDLYGGRSDLTTNSVLANSMKATTSDAANKLLERELSDSLLKSISVVWYRFHSAANRLFEQRLVPALHAEASEPLLLALQTIYNLRPFYEIASVQHGRPILSDETIKRLQMEATGLLNRATTSTSKKVPLSSAQQEFIVEDTEMDDAQLAYLDQLQGDSDLEFEELDDDVSSSTSQYDSKEIAESCSLILESLQHLPNETSSSDKPLTSLQHVKVSTLATEQDVKTTCHTAWAHLESETALPALVLSVDVVGQLLQNNIAPIDCSRTCEVLLPHMKQNKSFLQTIKVGSMTQTIDEGSTFRTMVYSTLLQIVTAHPTDYSVSCKLLMETVSRGIRDADPTINQLAIRIIEKLLEVNYETIIGIDPEWYVLTLVPRVAEIMTKVSKKLQLRTEVDQESEQRLNAPTLTAINVLDRLNYLFDRQYPAIA